MTVPVVVNVSLSSSDRHAPLHERLGWRADRPDRVVLSEVLDHGGDPIFVIATGRDPQNALVIERWKHGRMIGASFIGSRRIEDFAVGVAIALERARERWPHLLGPRARGEGGG